MLVAERQIVALPSNPREGRMPTYRLYHLDRFTGHIVSFEELHAGDDVEIVHLIEGRPRACPMELWQERRKVRHFAAAPDISIPSSGRPVARV